LKSLSHLIGILYLILAILLICAGATFLYLVKRDHKKFFLQYHKMLVAAICFLTLPLLLRVILDAMQNWAAWIQWVRSTSWGITTYNLLFFIFTTYSVIVSQCATLVFGLMRNN
jgi:hypothetical protein